MESCADLKLNYILCHSCLVLVITSMFLLFVILKGCLFGWKAYVLFCFVMLGEMAESKVVVPESVLKKIKREEEWALAKKQEAAAAKKKSVETRKLIFKRAEQYAKEYAEKVIFPLLIKIDSPLLMPGCPNE